MARINWFKEDQLDIISLDNDKAKIEYIMEKVDDWLKKYKPLEKRRHQTNYLNNGLKTSII